MVTSVTVTTGARLHFGPLAAAGSTGGKFGGVGMMVTAPGFVVSAQAANRDEFYGDQDACERVAEFVRNVRRSCPQAAAAPPIRIDVAQGIPSHAGLGSGTQLGLAVSRVFSELSGEQDVAIETLARRAGRGLRSAIGLHGFALGGFLVDGGRAASGELGTLVSRIEFPADWRLILAAPPSSTGLSGAAEQQAFAAQPPMPKSLTAELCRIALMDWLPGLIEADFERVSSAMYEFGLRVGEFFEPAQGGVFANPRMTQLVREVRHRGLAGAAQTSWGPTIGLLCEDSQSAQGIIDDLSRDHRWSDCRFVLTAPLNRGAAITCS